MLLDKKIQYHKDIELPKLIYKINSIILKQEFLIEFDKLILKVIF